MKAKTKKISDDVHDAALAAYHSYCDGIANLPESPTEQELIYVCAMAIAAERDRCLRIARGFIISHEEIRKEAIELAGVEFGDPYFNGGEAAATIIERAIEYQGSGASAEFERLARERGD